MSWQYFASADLLPVDSPAKTWLASPVLQNLNPSRHKVFLLIQEMKRLKTEEYLIVHLPVALPMAHRYFLTPDTILAWLTRQVITIRYRIFDHQSGYLPTSAFQQKIDMMGKIVIRLTTAGNIFNC
ncbi:hypothetical protein [Actinoallomurus acanthiterrae]